MDVDGACHCGALAFKAVVDPLTLTLCHCTDCQALSGSAFRANIACAADSFELTQGTPSFYIKVADSGARRRMAFCAVCGSQVYACAAEDPVTYSLRSGTLRQRADFVPARQIWVRSAVPWVRSLEDVPFVETGPPTR